MQTLQNHHAVNSRCIGVGRPHSLRVCRAVQTADPLQVVLGWAGNSKIATDKLAIANDVATDVPVFVAAKDLPAGDAILQVPDSAWVTADTAQKAAIGKYVGSLEPWLQLTLLLLAEKGQPGSSLSQYISGLPSQPSSPLFWSDEDLQLLEGTQLLEFVLGYNSSLSSTSSWMRSSSHPTAHSSQQTASATAASPGQWPACAASCMPRWMLTQWHSSH
ncbi:hypothetical protein COO60DRAFT_1060362 [Scenedesmus sp. NREL 46B-D3]|nr:hypothetical protein COO60DRAFT_1060362 [Scenedesmus sp. NREL 46B-D3]